MFIFVICLYLVSIFSFITFVVLSIVTFMNGSTVVWLLFSMISFLLGYIVFHKHTNKYPLNCITEYYTRDFKKLLSKNANCFEIRFVKKDNNWVCENNSLLVKLDLNGYAFEKSYLISYVVRNIRYPLISNKQSFKYLFANRFYIKNNMNVKLIIVNENKITEKMIVKNGVSKYGFIAKHISFAPFYLSGLSNRTYQSIRNFKSYIDEKRYKHFYIKNKSSKQDKYRNV